jgi:hypothetical protein
MARQKSIGLGNIPKKKKREGHIGGHSESSSHLDYFFFPFFEARSSRSPVLQKEAVEDNPETTPKRKRKKGKRKRHVR